MPRKKAFLSNALYLIRNYRFTQSQLDRLDAPDFLTVLLDCTVTGEVSRLCDVDQTALRPCGAVFITAADLFLCLDVGVKVRKYEVLVILHHQFIIDRTEVIIVSVPGPVDETVECLPDPLIPVDIVNGTVELTERINLFHLQTEYHIVFSADREQERLDSQKAARKSHSTKNGGTKNGSTKNSGRKQATTVRVDTDLNNPNAAGIYYDYLSATTHEMAAFYEHQWWGVLVTDIHIGSLIAEADVAGYNFWDPTPQWKTIGGVVFGGTLGAQLPITINRFLLCPRVTQSFTGGPMIGADHVKIAFLLDTRAGLDFRIPVGNVELVVGAHYTFNYSFCDLPFRETAYKTPTIGSMNHYLHHGFGVKLAVGF